MHGGTAGENVSRFCVGASPHDWIELETGFGRHCWRCGTIQFNDGSKGGKPVGVKKPKAPKAKKGRAGLPSPVKRRQTLLDRDGDRCVICGEPFTLADPPTLEHVKPASQGGGDGLDNLRLSHSRCNAERGTRPLIVVEARRPPSDPGDPK